MGKGVHDIRDLSHAVTYVLIVNVQLIFLNLRDSKKLIAWKLYWIRMFIWVTVQTSFATPDLLLIH